MKPKITYADTGATPPKVSDEYLRRNDLVAKAYGVAAGLGAAIDRGHVLDLLAALGVIR